MQYSKLLNTYLEPLPSSLISAEDGRLHTHFNQAVASTAGCPPRIRTCR